MCAESRSAVWCVVQEPLAVVAGCTLVLFHGLCGLQVGENQHRALYIESVDSSILVQIAVGCRVGGSGRQEKKKEEQCPSSASHPKSVLHASEQGSGEDVTYNRTSYLCPGKEHQMASVPVASLRNCPSYQRRLFTSRDLRGSPGIRKWLHVTPDILPPPGLLFPQYLLSNLDLFASSHHIGLPNESARMSRAGSGGGNLLAARRLYA